MVDQAKVVRLDKSGAPGAWLLGAFEGACSYIYLAHFFGVFTLSHHSCRMVPRTIAHGSISLMLMTHTHALILMQWPMR